jgi:hypothetical protein
MVPGRADASVCAPYFFLKGIGRGQIAEMQKIINAGKGDIFDVPADVA